MLRRLNFPSPRFVCLLISFIACQSWFSVAQTVPAHSHVIVVAFENHSFVDVVNNGAMPKYNTIIGTYGLATNFYSNVHGSLANYYYLTMGTSRCNSEGPLYGPPNDTLPTCQDGLQITADKQNIVTVLNSLGLTWKSYQENLRQAGEIAEGDSLPTDCIVTSDDSKYVPRHNPFAYFSESRLNFDGTTVAPDAGCNTNPSALLDCANHPDLQGCNIVPFDNFQADLDANTLPNFSFITPNIDDDAHEGDLGLADSWIGTHIQNILDSSYFHAGGDGLLILWWDEGNAGDTHCDANDDTSDDPETIFPGQTEPPINCGGQIAIAVIAPDGNRKFQGGTYYQHPSLLRTVLEALGVNPGDQNNFPGKSLDAPDMAEFFTGPKVTVTTPSDRATVGSPVNIQASATPSAGQTITGWHIYVDDQDLFQQDNVSSISANIAMSSGTHTVIVRAWDSSVNETFGDQTLFVTVP